jgi:hypothetical protein
MKGILPGVFLLLLLAGCQTPRPLYYWGHYESLIYQGYTKPGKATPELQVEKLQEDIQKAAAANLSVHPGLHAHLGYLYFQMGNLDLARKEFEAEKTLFPEAAPFMDRMLKKIAPQGTP